MPVVSYVLRIYCEPGETASLPPLIGLIEDATGEERSFKSLEELGLILRQKFDKRSRKTRRQHE